MIPDQESSQEVVIDYSEDWLRPAILHSLAASMSEDQGAEAQRQAREWEARFQRPRE
jgi:hypothetical protein